MAVAVISQTLRSDYCRAYLERERDRQWLLLVVDGSEFDAAGLPSWVSVHVIDPAQNANQSFVRRSKQRLRQRMSAWSTSGSTAGFVVGAFSRGILRWVRKLRRQSRTPTFADAVAEDPDLSISTDPVLRALEELSHTHLISEIVVFDLFDLPGAMMYARDRPTRVLVR